MYRGFEPGSETIAPILDYFKELFEEETALADASALQRLHNRSPTLLSAVQQAILDRRAKRYNSALSRLSEAIDDHSSYVEESGLRLEAQAEMLRQRANIHWLKHEFDEAVNDLALARRITPFERLGDIELLTRSLWAAVGKRMVQIDDFDEAAAYLET